MDDLTQVGLGEQGDQEQRVLIAKQPDGTFIVENQDGEQEAADFNEALEIVRASFGEEADVSQIREEAEEKGGMMGPGMPGMGNRGILNRGGGM